MLLHDWASGTLVANGRTHSSVHVLQSQATAYRVPSLSHRGYPEMLGEYTVTGLLWDCGNHALLSAKDTKLEREVWIQLTPNDQPTVPEARRVCARTTRLRWLTGGNNVLVLKQSRKLQVSACALLRESARLAGCGISRPFSSPATRIDAILPLHARDFLASLQPSESGQISHLKAAELLAWLLNNEGDYQQVSQLTDGFPTHLEFRNLPNNREQLLLHWEQEYQQRYAPTVTHNDPNVAIETIARHSLA